MMRITLSVLVSTLPALSGWSGLASAQENGFSEGESFLLEAMNVGPITVDTPATVLSIESLFPGASVTASEEIDESGEYSHLSGRVVRVVDDEPWLTIFRAPGDRISKIRIHSERFRTADGLGVGSTLADLVATEGEWEWQFVELEEPELHFTRVDEEELEFSGRCGYLDIAMDGTASSAELAAALPAFVISTVEWGCAACPDPIPPSDETTPHPSTMGRLADDDFLSLVAPALGDDHLAWSTPDGNSQFSQPLHGSFGPFSEAIVVFTTNWDSGGFVLVANDDASWSRVDLPDLNPSSWQLERISDVFFVDVDGGTESEVVIVAEYYTGAGVERYELFNFNRVIDCSPTECALMESRSAIIESLDDRSEIIRVLAE